jgi:hypothetical protein
MVFPCITCYKNREHKELPPCVNAEITAWFDVRGSWPRCLGHYRWAWLLTQVRLLVLALHQKNLRQRVQSEQQL